MQCLSDPLHQSEAWKKGYKSFPYLIVQGLLLIIATFFDFSKNILSLEGFGDAPKCPQSIKEILILSILRREETGLNPFSS